MVSYQRWTAIFFEVAAQKGADTSNVTELAEPISEVWNRRKDELDMATIAEATRIAQQEIRVS